MTGREGGTDTAALSFRDVSKVFSDGTVAIDDVSLDIERDEVVAIVGPSGCGKSTLLRIVAGLSQPTAGEVVVDESRLGFVFQDPTLLPWRRVLGNLELPGQLGRLPRRQRRAVALEALELTGLRGFERHWPRQLSGGMRMRVSLARELTAHPRLFLLDEPFAALDEITRQRLDDELLRLHAAESFAALFVTHSVVEAVYLSSRVLVMSRRPGRIVADIPVPLPYPRSEELRFTPEFGRVAAEVSDQLRSVS